MNNDDDDNFISNSNIRQVVQHPAITNEERAIEYLSQNRPDKLAVLLRQIPCLNKEALEILAFMLDGKSDDDRLMRACHPFAIRLKRWTPSRPKKPRTLNILESRAVRLVASFRDEGKPIKVAIPLVAEQIEKTTSFVRAAWYASSKRSKPRLKDES